MHVILVKKYQREAKSDEDDENDYKQSAVKVCGYRYQQLD
jgi:hypothetical protein